MSGSPVQLVRLEAYPDFALHPESVEVIKFAEQHKSSKPFQEMTIEEIRMQHNQRYAALCSTNETFEVTRTEELVPSPHDKGNTHHVHIVSVHVHLKLCY